MGKREEGPVLWSYYCAGGLMGIPAGCGCGSTHLWGEKRKRDHCVLSGLAGGLYMCSRGCALCMYVCSCVSKVKDVCLCSRVLCMARTPVQCRPCTHAFSPVLFIYYDHSSSPQPCRPQDCYSMSIGQYMCSHRPLCLEVTRCATV